MIDILDDDNFILFAAKFYDNPQCHSTEEFLEDVNRFKYLKRLFGKYSDTGELRERLILNHIIIIYNMWGTSATKMLFLKLNEYQHMLKPFVLFLGFMPDRVEGLHEVIYSSDIIMDQKIINTLRSI
jgi:hypothetical protein